MAKIFITNFQSPAGGAFWWAWFCIDGGYSPLVCGLFVMSQPPSLPGPPSLCIQHGLESRALSANTSSQHKQWSSYALRLAHQPILSCAIKPVLMSLWTHSCGIKVNAASSSSPFISLLLCWPLCSFCLFTPATDQQIVSKPCQSIKIQQERLAWFQKQQLNSLHPKGWTTSCSKWQRSCWCQLFTRLHIKRVKGAGITEERCTKCEVI